MASKYEKAKELRAVCDTQITELLPQLKTLKANMAEFYALMRWENLDCGEKKYEALYENFVYPYEEKDIDEYLGRVIGFMEKDFRAYNEEGNQN